MFEYINVEYVNQNARASKYKIEVLESEYINNEGNINRIRFFVNEIDLGINLNKKPWTDVGLVLINTYNAIFKDILNINTDINKILPDCTKTVTVEDLLNSFAVTAELKLSSLRFDKEINYVMYIGNSAEELKNLFIALGVNPAKDITISNTEDEVLIDKEERLESVKICNLDSQEMHHECKILGSIPDGIVDMNTTPHQFAVDLFKKMIARHWVAEQINMAKDANAIKLLSKAEKHVLKLNLNHLTNNDSDQTAQLSRIKEYISSPMVNNALARQEFEECVHSESYSRYLKEALEDDGTILYMHRPYLNGKPNPDFDNELLLKNKAVSEMYLDLYKGIKPTKEDMLIIFVANQILEELVFPGGFVACYILGEKLRALTEMIAEINKDGTQALVA